MLVLTRRLGEKIRIGDDIEIIIVDIKQDVVRIGINAPREVTVLRSEVYQAIQEENKAAALKADSLQGLAQFLKDFVEKSDTEL